MPSLSVCFFTHNEQYDSERGPLPVKYNSRFMDVLLMLEEFSEEQLLSRVESSLDPMAHDWNWESIISPIIEL